MFRTKPSAETKGMFNGVRDSWDTKTLRRVRTEAGERRFKQPIGSVIIGNGKLLTNLTLEESEYSGFDKVTTASGKTWYIGKFPDEDEITVNDENDKELYKAKNLEDAFSWADQNGDKRITTDPKSTDADKPDSYSKPLDKDELNKQSITKIRAQQRELEAAIKKHGTNKVAGDNRRRLRNAEIAADNRRNSGETKPKAPTGGSDADKIKNAEKMYGTGSPQHEAAKKKFGGGGGKKGETLGDRVDIEEDVTYGGQRQFYVRVDGKPVFETRNTGAGAQSTADMIAKKYREALASDLSTRDGHPFIKDGAKSGKKGVNTPEYSKKLDEYHEYVSQLETRYAKGSQRQSLTAYGAADPKLQAMLKELDEHLEASGRKPAKGRPFKNYPQAKGDTMEDLQYKAVPIAEVTETEEGTGVVEAIVAVTGIKDNVNDIILPGAFQKSLAARMPKGVWHHDIRESVSRTESIKELPPGHADLPAKLPNGDPWPEEAGALKVKTVFNLNTSRGKDAYEDVKFFGPNQEWSIGYSVPTGGATIDRKSGGVRKINTLDLYEYSPVLFGAMPLARTVSVKSAQEGRTAYLNLNDPANLELKEMWDEMVAVETKEAKKKRVAPEDEEESEESADDKEKTKATEGPKKEDETTEAEDEPVDDDEEVEEEDEVDTTKKQRKSIVLNADGVDMLDTAIKALSELRDYAIEAVKADTTDGDGGTVSEDEGSADSESLTSLVESASLDVSDAAQAFDDAVESGDSGAMEDAASTILDAVEEAKDGEDSDTDALKRVTSYIASALSNVEPEEETPSEEKSGAETTEPEDTDETVVVDVKDWMTQLGLEMT